MTFEFEIKEVDCDEHKSVCSKYGIQGYPTIQWFPKGSLDPEKDHYMEQDVIANLVVAKHRDHYMHRTCGRRKFQPSLWSIVSSKVKLL
ncbi:hypothetical protein V6N13_140288 [Hibiscus sabdariffa]